MKSVSSSDSLNRQSAANTGLAAAAFGLLLFAAVVVGSVALAADTIVLVGGEVLGKPRDRSDAERMLRILSGIEHRVITAVCVPPGATSRGGSVVA